MNIHFKKLRDNAKLPTRGTERSAGLDLFLLEDFYLMHGTRCKLGSGLAIAIPTGMVGLLRPRSSAFARGLMCTGTIDADYRGEIFMNIHNTGIDAIKLEKGKSYIQLVIVKYEHLEPEFIDELGNTARGESGYGSTGNV